MTMLNTSVYNADRQMSRASGSYAFVKKVKLLTEIKIMVDS